MSTMNYPTKQQVRDWLSQRLLQQKPLPDIKQIRRELGWDMLGTCLRSVASGPQLRPTSAEKPECT
jgi:hypothetical protein